MKDMHMDTMEELNKSLNQNNYFICNIIMDIKPIPKPVKTIKIKDIKYIEYLDMLYDSDWINDYFNPKK